MASAVQPRFYTLEEYLAMEREADHKSEYRNGQIYAMAGAIPEHNQITRNILGELYVPLRGKPCEAFPGDMRVTVQTTGLNTYPDVSVVCGEMRFRDERRDALINPAVIFEVLSDSTEAYDRGTKWAHYQQIESLTDYILVSQKEPPVERFSRQPSNRWLLETSIGIEEMLLLSSIDCALRLADIYDRVMFVQRDPPVLP